MNSSLKSPFQQVSEFQELILEVPSMVYPRMLTEKEKLDNLHYLLEELREILEAFSKNDIVGTADGLADLVYFAYGIAHKMGLPFDHIWHLVHEANMSKKRGINKRGIEGDAVKPADWVDPKIRIEDLIRSYRHAPNR